MSRHPADVRAKEEYLQSGRVPWSYAIQRGLLSVIRDPWLMLIMNMPGPLGYKLRQLWFARKVASMGKGVLIDQNVNIPNLSNLYLDDFCYLGWGLSLYAPEGYVRIGKRCHVAGWILGHEGVEIGDYVASGGMLLSVSDSHQGGFRMSGPMIPMEQRHLRRGKIVIEKDAFIGQQSIVMPGVRVGEGAVVAPFSLVVRDVRPWTVVSGVPAVKISTRDPVRFPDPD